MGKMKNEFIKLQQLLHDNAEAQRHGLDEAHWRACAEMIQPLVDTEKITLEGLDALFNCADDDE